MMQDQFARLAFLPSDIIYDFWDLFAVDISSWRGPPQVDVKGIWQDIYANVFDRIGCANKIWICKENDLVSIRPGVTYRALVIKFPFVLRCDEAKRFALQPHFRFLHVNCYMNDPKKPLREFLLKHLASPWLVILDITVRECADVVDFEVEAKDEEGELEGDEQDKCFLDLEHELVAFCLKDNFKHLNLNRRILSLDSLLTIFNKWKTQDVKLYNQGKSVRITVEDFRFSQTYGSYEHIIDRLRLDHEGDRRKTITRKETHELDPRYSAIIKVEKHCSDLSVAVRFDEL